MALIEEVHALCARLAPHGWSELVRPHGLDLDGALASPDRLADALRALLAVDRTAPGFEDFALEGRRGIEPGRPSHSLLFHALASPNVTRRSDGVELTSYPTLAELQTVERYVFAVRNASLEEILVQAQADLSRRHGQQEPPPPVGVAVFSREYRPASLTCHRRHADFVFSRTGVARIGTTPARYHPRSRGFVALDDGDPHSIRILPSQFAVYLAVESPASESEFCPMPSRRRVENPNGDDHDRRFWVPVHALFPGTECLRGRDVSVGEFEVHHVNEKIARIHRILLGAGIDGGHDEADLLRSPFTFSDGIAEILGGEEFGSGVVAPVPHPLVEEATFEGHPLTLRVPARRPVEHPTRENPSIDTFSSSLELRASDGGPRRAPEYVHVRTLIRPDGSREDLNRLDDPEERVGQGGYEALHYVDRTADGWVTVAVGGLQTGGAGNAGALPLTARPAYSLVASPDFFTRTDQRELTEWSTAVRPSETRLWATLPQSLADERMPPNLQLRRDGQAPFGAEDATATAIVGLLGEITTQVAGISVGNPTRHSHLPDDAAGVFAPGWDVSFDESDGVPHLSAYGLGSPFPEDAKLCAALSTFWAAVAPDASRAFGNAFGGTVAPLTDAEIGMEGGIPWDGVAPPRQVGSGATAEAEFASIAHADYVANALGGRFSLFLTSVIDAQEYENRVLRMVNAYAALGVPTQEDPQRSDLAKRREWIVHSFLRIENQHSDLIAARSQAGGVPEGSVYRFVMYRPGAVRPGPPGRVRVPMTRQTTLIVDDRQVWKSEGGAWTRTNAAIKD